MAINLLASNMNTTHTTQASEAAPLGGGAGGFKAAKIKHKCSNRVLLACIGRKVMAVTFQPKKTLQLDKRIPLR